MVHLRLEFIKKINKRCERLWGVPIKKAVGSAEKREVSGLALRARLCCPGAAR